MKRKMKLELIKRQGNIGVYAQNINGYINSYEVHIIRKRKNAVAKFKQPNGTYKEVVFPEREYTACDEDFGTFAWSFATKEAAMEKFNEMVGEDNRGYKIKPREEPISE